MTVTIQQVANGFVLTQGQSVQVAVDLPTAVSLLGVIYSLPTVAPVPVPNELPAAETPAEPAA